MLSSPAAGGDDESGTRYFQVVWCEFSRKKHIKWDGDAFLQLKGRSVVLKDPEGKDMCRTSGMKQDDVRKLLDGDVVSFSGRQVQTTNEITAENWASGKCFLATAAPAGGADEPTKAGQYTFSKLNTGGFRQVAPTAEPIVREIKPRHDPSNPDAVVLPRPSKEHQKQYNKANLQVVDVVIDPHLSSQLRPHQCEGVKFLYECLMSMRDYSGSGAILADDMGLGKTIQCITLMWTLMKQGPYGGAPVVRRTIVVTPGALVKNWEKEFRKWLGTERIAVYAVTPDRKIDDFLASNIYQVLIISYEMLNRNIDVVKKCKFDLLICDEAHRLKNTEIKTSTVVSSIETRRRIALTGTPIQNDLGEFFAIVEFVNPGVLGTASVFRRIYEDPIVKSRQPDATKEERALGNSRATELSRMVALFCIRRTDEVNRKYLPPKHESVVFCRPTPLQASIYEKLIGSRLVKSCISTTCGHSAHLVSLNHHFIIFPYHYLPRFASLRSRSYAIRH